MKELQVQNDDADDETIDFSSVCDKVVVLGEYEGSHDGRVDHSFKIYCSMLENRKTFDSVVISMQSLVATLREDTKHVLHVPEKEAKCGLVPFGNPARNVFSEGFRWNLNDHTLSIPDFVSTSNETTEKTVSVKAAGALLFTLTLAREPLWRRFITRMLSFE